MKRLWAPWRSPLFKVLKAPSKARRTACLFCDVCSARRDKSNHIVERREHSFVMLNLYPYSPGHVLIAPYRHAADLESLREVEYTDMTQAVRDWSKVLKSVYRADGMNVGANVGKAGGAAFPEHIHFHVLPRWVGDTNFMMTLNETRILPESMQATLKKLKKHSIKKHSVRKR